MLNLSINFEDLDKLDKARLAIKQAKNEEAKVYGVEDVMDLFITASHRGLMYVISTPYSAKQLISTQYTDDHLYIITDSIELVVYLKSILGDEMCYSTFQRM